MVFPYDKFFELDEVDGWRQSDFEQMEATEIVEKIDGSLVSFLIHNNQQTFVTKGGFDTEQAKAAERIAQQYDMTLLQPQRYTYNFEVVYAQNRFPNGFIAVHYETDGLFLIGVRDRHTNHQLPYAEVIKIAKQCGFRNLRNRTGSVGYCAASGDEDFDRVEEIFVYSKNSRACQVVE